MVLVLQWYGQCISSTVRSQNCVIIQPLALILGSTTRITNVIIVSKFQLHLHHTLRARPPRRQLLPPSCCRNRRTHRSEKQGTIDTARRGSVGACADTYWSAFPSFDLSRVRTASQDLRTTRSPAPDAPESAGCSSRGGANPNL